MGSFNRKCIQVHRPFNSFHPSIKFTYNISNKNVNFLDVTVSKLENIDLFKIIDSNMKSTNVLVDICQFYI